MLRELLKRELAWKYAPYVALAAAVIWPFVLLKTASPADSPFFIVFYVVLGTAWAGERRASPFEAALPIPGRQLAAARLIAPLTMLWLSSLAIIAEALALRRREHAVTLLMLAAVLTFAMLVEQSLRIHQARPPRFGSLLGFAGFLLVVPPLSLHTIPALGILAAASAVLLWRLWVRVPQGFQLAPTKLKRVGRLDPRRWFSGRAWASNWWPAWRAILRGWGLALLFVPVLPSAGVWLAGALLVLVAAGICRRVEWLALLPISRRRLLFMTVLPGISILLALPFLAARFMDPPKPPVVSTGSGTPGVEVPATYWHWAADDDVVIRAPWGEETQPKTYLRLGLPYYNPYSVGPKNSPRFLEWQFARATQAVYGRSIPLAQSAQLRSPGWIPATRKVRTQCIAALGGSLMFLGLLLLTFWFKAGGGGCLTTFIWFLLFLPFAGDMLTAWQLRQSGPLRDILALRFAALLPESWAALLPLALLLLAAFYLALERQFKRVELAANLRRLGDPERRKR